MPLDAPRPDLRFAGLVAFEAKCIVLQSFFIQLCTRIALCLQYSQRNVSSFTQIGSEDGFTDAFMIGNGLVAHK